MRRLPLLLVLLSAMTARAELSIFACEPEWAALASELAGEHANVFSATTAQQDVHHIQARPALIAKLRGADLAVCTGAELEIGWLPLLQRRARNPKVLPGKTGFLEASRYVRMREVPQSLDRADGDVHPRGNPHIQTDPRNITLVAIELGTRLAVLDPENSADYRQRLEDFEQRWRAAITDWEQRAAPLQGARIVVHHHAWPYLFAWLDLARAGTLEPKPGVPPTPGHLAELKAQLEQDPARMVIRTPYASAKPSEWLSEQVGIPALVLPFTVGGTPAAVDLFGLFDDTIARLLGPVGS
ncbi:MAG: zinc ABC transporter substrate-binding protein [Chromatiales bacterium]|jgi:zinc/manganese transport system substrate-binding protein